MKLKTTIIASILLFLLILGVFVLFNNKNLAIRRMCKYVQKQYPEATLQDIYKTCYQDCFGSAHLSRDTAAVRHYLHQELESVQNEDLSAIPKHEPTGYRHRFTRINLSCVIDEELTEEELLKLFLEAAAPGNALELDWAKEWGRIEKIALKVNPDWADPDLQAYLRESARTKQAVMHSEPFRQAYHPHYRIIKKQAWKTTCSTS